VQGSRRVGAAAAGRWATDAMARGASPAAMAPLVVKNRGGDELASDCKALIFKDSSSAGQKRSGFGSYAKLSRQGSSLHRLAAGASLRSAAAHRYEPESLPPKQSARRHPWARPRRSARPPRRPRPRRPRRTPRKPRSRKPERPRRRSRPRQVSASRRSATVSLHANASPPGMMDSNRRAGQGGRRGAEEAPASQTRRIERT